MIALLLLACKGGDSDTDDGIIRDLVFDTTPRVVSTETCGACYGGCQIETLSYPSRYHTLEPIDYAVTPPAGGPHNPCWATWGEHPEPVPDDNFVHNLEHGGMVILHDCEGGCIPDFQALDNFVAGTPDWLLVTPYEGAGAPFTGLTWGKRLTTSCFETGVYAEFYQDNLDNAPESTDSEPPAECGQ